VTVEPETLASSVGAGSSYSVTFEVSEFFLEDAEKGEWSGPVQFRFERRGGRWDLVMRRVAPVSEKEQQ